MCQIIQVWNTHTHIKGAVCYLINKCTTMNKIGSKSNQMTVQHCKMYTSAQMCEIHIDGIT